MHEGRLQGRAGHAEAVEGRSGRDNVRREMRGDPFEAAHPSQLVMAAGISGSAGRSGVLAALLIAIGLVSGCGPSASSRNLRITTGTEGGTYLTVGRVLARLLEEYSGNAIGRVEAVPSPGTPKNLARLIAGEADLALAQGLVVARDPRREGIRVLMSLYTDRLQIVVHRSARIETVADLKGKSIYVGANQSGTKVVANGGPADRRDRRFGLFARR
jgi:hypothetical protein